MIPLENLRFDARDSGANDYTSDTGFDTLAPFCFAPAMNLRHVKCPQCGAPVPWTPDSRWRPFCSQRCKLVDLGAWASERYRVATPEAPDPDADAPESLNDR